jgi:acyl dehydratase
VVRGAAASSARPSQDVRTFMKEWGVDMDVTTAGGLAASGWHTAAVTMRLQVTSGLPIAGGIIGAGGELTWPRPTRATDVLHVVSEVVQIQPSKSKPDRGMVTVRSETRNQHGDVLQLSTVRIVVPRKPAASGAGD